MTQNTPSAAAAPKEWSTWSTMPKFGQPVVQMDVFAAPDGSMLYYVIVRDGDSPGLYACCRQDSSAQFTPVDDAATTWWWKVIGGQVTWAKAETTKDGHVAWCLLTHQGDPRGPQNVHIAVTPKVTPRFTFDAPNNPMQMNVGWTARPMQIDSTRRDDGRAAFLLIEMSADVNVVDRAPGLTVIQEDDNYSFHPLFVNGSDGALPDTATFCNDIYGNLTVLGLKNGSVVLATTQRADGVFLPNADAEAINAAHDRLAFYYDQVMDGGHAMSIQLSGPMIFVDYKARLSFLMLQDGNSVSYYRAETPLAGFPPPESRVGETEPTSRQIFFGKSGRSAGATAFYTSLDTSRKEHSGNKSWLDLAVTYAATSDVAGRCFFCQITPDGVIQTGYQGDGRTDAFELNFEKNPVPLPNDARVQWCVPGVNALGKIALFAVDTEGGMYACERLTALGPADTNLLNRRSCANDSLVEISKLLGLDPDSMESVSRNTDTAASDQPKSGKRLKEEGLGGLAETLVDVVEDDAGHLIKLLSDLAEKGEKHTTNAADKVLALLEALSKEEKSVLEQLMDHHLSMNDFGKVFETLGDEALSLAKHAVSDVEDLFKSKGEADYIKELIKRIETAAVAVGEIQKEIDRDFPTSIDLKDLKSGLGYLEEAVADDQVHPLSPLTYLLQQHLPDPSILDKISDAAADLKDPGKKTKAERVRTLAVAKSAAEIVSSVLKVANESFPTRLKFGVNLGIAGKVAARGVLEGNLGLGFGAGLDVDVPIVGVGAYGGGAGGNRSIIKVKAIGLAITPMVLGPVIAILDSGAAFLDLAIDDLS